MSSALSFYSVGVSEFSGDREAVVDLLYVTGCAFEALGKYSNRILFHFCQGGLCPFKPHAVLHISTRYRYYQ